uniref:Uncharacterized protein n=1 Tax=Sus scrofa TaxID=9823 RepID=A0A8D0MW90_PIG
MIQQSHSWDYIQKRLIQKETCSPMFIAVLFTTAKTCKQPKCPSTDEWIKKMWCIYTVEYYLAIKKKEIMPSVATRMQREILILSKVSQKEKDKYHTIILIYRIKNMARMNLFTKQKQTHRHREQTCSCRGGGRGIWTGSLGLVGTNYYI